VLGVIGVHDIQLYGKREGELGYWVRLSARGRGVAATAIRTMAAFAFNDLRLARASMRVRLDHVSSRRAAERAGARYEGALRHGIVQGEARFDAALYALLPDDLGRTWAP
jgi:RimJ/RimL family protein N-acetyltransferase